MILSRKTRFYVLVSFQLLLLIGLIAYKQVTLLTGQPILLKTIPVDPRDLFRGDYVVLDYEISHLEAWHWRDVSFSKGDKVYVTLRREGRFWVAASARSIPPEGDRVFIQGNVSAVADYDITVQYGIESYFVPEGTGLELEREAGEGLIVEAMVDRHGRAVIKRVHIGPHTRTR